MTEPKITVGKGGRISINKVAFKEYFKGQRFVEFYYNKSKGIVAMKVLNSPTRDSYEIKTTTVGNVGFINTIGFFKHSGIDVSVKHDTEILEVDKDSSIIYFTLKR